MQVQQLPYIAPRKHRESTNRFVVKWIQGDTMYFQWFKRDSAAVKFLNTLLARGTAATLTQKGNV
jgi:hypothetical protein